MTSAITKKPKIVAIVGPTTAGKTKLSLTLAQEFSGEVISADSRQVYRQLNIGTGKVTTTEMAGVPHHLLSIADIDHTYTALNFKKDASQAIEQIIQNGRQPIVVGGTFFYLDLLRGKAQSAPVPPNKKLRTKLEKFPTAELFTLLQQKDPVRAVTIDPHNRRRLIRSLEIIATLGTVPKLTQTNSPYDWLIIGLQVDKAQLLENFAKRIKQWLANGFQVEVEDLLQAGITKERFQEIGFEYTLMIKHLEGEITKPELIEQFIQKNWQYAKRQRLWLKRDPAIIWFDKKEYDKIKCYVTNHLNNN